MFVWIPLGALVSPTIKNVSLMSSSLPLTQAGLKTAAGSEFTSCDLFADVFRNGSAEKESAHFIFVSERVKFIKHSFPCVASAKEVKLNG